MQIREDAAIYYTPASECNHARVVQARISFELFPHRTEVAITCARVHIPRRPHEEIAQECPAGLLSPLYNRGLDATRVIFSSSNNSFSARIKKFPFSFLIKRFDHSALCTSDDDGGVRNQ